MDKKLENIWLDCRPVAVFNQGHWRKAGHIPVVDLPQSMHLLPESSVPISLMGNEESVEQASAFLLNKGYQVADRLVLNEQLIANWRSLNQWVSGVDSQRLWQPSPLIHRFVHELMSLHGIKAGKGLDIGCGSGRDLVYCAMHGWQMTGVDVQPAAVARAQALARSQQVGISTQVRDLETGFDPFADFDNGCFDLISVARYLHRPLFPVIKRLLAKDGVIIYHTFMVGSEAFGSPKNPNFLLKKGELAEVFHDFEVLLDEVLLLPDGRPMTMFVARMI